MDQRLAAAFEELMEKIPELVLLFKGSEDTANFSDMTDTPSYYLQRGYEAFVEMGEENYGRFVGELCSVVEKYPELLEPASISIGESEFLKLSSRSERDACAYLEKFPKIYSDIVGADALRYAIKRGGFQKR